MAPMTGPTPALLESIKQIIRRDLKLGPDEPIADDMPLVGGEFDLDSLDILMLITSMEKEFGVKIDSESVGREVFATVHSLASFVAAHQPTGQATAPPGPAGDGPGDWADRLPHQPPFRFVSAVEALTPGVSAAGAWDLSGDEDFFAGHFPGRPLVPGVLIAEALAQLSGLLVTGPSGAADRRGMLAHTDVRFRRPVTPPAKIALSSRLTQASGALHRFDVSASVGEQVVADGTITLHVGSDDAAGEAAS